MLSNITLNGGSSLQYDDEGSELVTTIYELEKKKLELGQLIGQVWIVQSLFISTKNLSLLLFKGILRRGTYGGYSP